MYEELIDALRRIRQRVKADPELACQVPPYLIGAAADAIEELSRKEKFHAFLWNTIQPNEMEAYISMYNAENEKGEA